jgi:hypothetical protein
MTTTARLEHTARHRADLQHPAFLTWTGLDLRGGSAWLRGTTTYPKRAYTDETTWGHLDDYEPAHRADTSLDAAAAAARLAWFPYTSTWEELHPATREHWRAVARAVLDTHTTAGAP